MDIDVNFLLIARKLRLKLKEEDKVKHIAWSFWITAFGLIFLSAHASVLVAFIIGFAKEVWDHFFGSGFCWFDMLGNIVGIVFALIIYIFMIWSFSLI
ncbi:hypothetical protein [Rhodoferax sp.]|uniref:hypothetical protein n=1 Tax=Rhodoferax sp. TaxID=50421 RepID=UPI002639993E|nr:hypothetical protein [Rhodoferax sp.]MDD2809709.1 hypothetical protein [Rhodoferax sp.]MDD4943710.1 hypothetical protein [Rhodoferax sp.]